MKELPSIRASIPCGGEQQSHPRKALLLPFGVQGSITVMMAAQLLDECERKTCSLELADKS